MTINMIVASKTKTLTFCVCLSLSETCFQKVHTFCSQPFVFSSSSSPKSIASSFFKTMAMHTQTLSNAISPEVVGNMFVEQYYHFLHHSPEVVFKFYDDQSVLSRPDSNGLMTSTTTMQGINEKILSMGYNDYKAEIKTADAQKSHGDGVIVLVTGCLTGKNNLKRNFTQTFFLAPQDNGYFVLNDVCRYIEDASPLGTNHVNHTNDIPDQLAPVSEPALVVISPEPVPAVPSAHIVNVVEKTHESVDNDEAKAIESSAVVDIVSDSKDNGTSAVGEPFSSTDAGDAPKKSYALIVSSESKMSKSHGRKATASRTEKVYVPTDTKKVTVKVAPEKTEREVSNSVDRPSVPEPQETSDITTEKNIQHEEAEGHSIYIRNLPYDVTVAQVGSVFEKFGPIKTGGIQVRCHKEVAHCFGFVEFQSVDSMIKAVEASPVSVGGRQVIVETKKTTSRAGMGGRRFFYGRGSFHNENFRGRENFSGGGGGRAYNTTEYGDQSDFSTNNSHGPLSRGGGYHRGRGRSNQSDVQRHNPVPIRA
ncbi:unnamed protein product [Rhodiola kirilowii]